MKLAFITDIHFGRLTPGADAALLADLRAQQPHLILIGGDVTQRGLASQYKACQQFLAALPAPYVCVTGNHDVPAWNLLERFVAPYHAYQKFITRDLNPTWVNDRVAVQGLNSARRMMADWQIDLAVKFFAQHPDKTKILMVHHPLTQPVASAEAGAQQKTKLLVHNHEHALNMFAAASVDMICTGHLHRASVRDIQTDVPSRRKPLWMIMGGTATCDRLRGEANSYWMIETGAGPTFILRTFDGKKFA
jgi:3',5'-cyclic AMP phosphodiesterase CpdA